MDQLTSCRRSELLGPFLEVEYHPSYISAHLFAWGDSRSRDAPDLMWRLSASASRAGIYHPFL